MAIYILVHGAFVDGWSWHKVQSLLEERGHKAIAFDIKERLKKYTF